MRVVHLARYGGPYAGSFVAMVRAVAAACARRGWDCEAVFDPQARDRDWYPELSAELPVRTGRGDAGFVADLLAESAGPTLLHTHFTGFDLPALTAARRRPQTAVVWHLHTRLDSGPVAAARNALKFGVLGRRVDRIVCAGPGIAAVARRRLARRVEVLPNAIDADRFPSATDEERRAARRRLDLPADRPVLVHFGWDWEMKGGDLFVAAARELAARGTDAVPLSIGAAAARDGLVVRPPSHDVRQVYAAADVFVSSSPAEGDPYSVLEALATGTPVVAAPRSHGEAGERVAACRVAERTPAAFADAIAATLERPRDAAAADRAEARDWILRERDLRAWADRVTDVYERAAARR